MTVVVLECAPDATSSKVESISVISGGVRLTGNFVIFSDNVGSIVEHDTDRHPGLIGQGAVVLDFVMNYSGPYYALRHDARAQTCRIYISARCTSCVVVHVVSDN